MASLSSSSSPERSLGPLLSGLVDDAALFPPGNAPVPEAVRGHARHRTAWYAGLVGPFVCSDRWLPDLTAQLDADAPPTPLRVTLVVAGGAGAIGPAVNWAVRHPDLELAGVEVAVRADEGSPGGLAHNATRVTTALDEALRTNPATAELPAYVELPRTDGAEPAPAWQSAADVLATYGHPLKLRTGGETPEAHPGAVALAGCIDAALDRELAIKATAGLHHAVRHTSQEGFEQHGFLNVLLATRALLDGSSATEAAAVLENRDATAVAGAVADWDDDLAGRTRRWFRSFGSCSVDEPLRDLVQHGLARPPEEESS